MRYTIVLPALLMAIPAAAQDISPVIDLGEVSRGQVVGATMGAHARRIEGRSSSRRATPGQIQACSQKSQFRAEYGADHPKVQRLYSLCRGIGR